MTLNIQALADLKAAIHEEDSRYCTTISVLNKLAGNGAIDFSEVERTSEALQPRRNELKAIAAAADHASNVRNHELSPLPFMPAPAPLTADEEKLLENAWCSYFDI